MSFNILGTMTAGETAATTAPMMAASKIEIPNNLGANKTIPNISKQAGTKHMSMAGRPTFFKSFTSKERPALVKMMMSAMRRKSEDMFKIESSIILREYGPRMIPVKSIPIKLGKWIFLHIHPINIPINKIIEILISIKFILLFH